MSSELAVWTAVVGAGVWTGGVAEGDAHPAMTIVAIRKDTYPDWGFVVYHIIKPFCFNLITVINPSDTR